MFTRGLGVPFSNDRLDNCLGESDVDLILATSRHNVRYLLGGYQPFFLAGMDAFGLSRVVPTLGYPKGKPHLAFYLGNPTESYQQEVEPIWVPTVLNKIWTTQEAAGLAARLIADLDMSTGTVAIETPFMPADFLERLRELLPKVHVVDGVAILEHLRAVKSRNELSTIRDAAEAVVDAMLAAIHGAKPGCTTGELAEVLRKEETLRGLTFDYALITVGTSFNRFPSHRRWEPGTILSLDSGGNKAGYICDMCRMAVMGPPTPEMEGLLNEVDTVQFAARSPIRAGVLGHEIYESANRAISRLPHRDQVTFVAHGMGLISHEAPRLSERGSIPYSAAHANKALETGMVLSIETHIKSPDIGFVKLEDTVVVTDTGIEAYADSGRGWNVVE